MSDRIHGVLHIGGPKCGSSALQSVLSTCPNLTGSLGAFHYVAAESVLGRLAVLEGADLARWSRRSPYGYLSWPNLMPRDDNATLWAQLEVVLVPPPRNSVAILSNEGWIAHPRAFAAQLEGWGNPHLMAIAYVRPPLDWLNAAFWQWGIWTGLTFGQWYARANMQYRFGSHLQAWADIPNLDLRIRSARQDVIKSFGADLGVDMPRAGAVNRSAPPALIGFLMRNRPRFRPTAHSAQTEFIVQRWCTWAQSAPLWALSQEDVLAVRGQTRADVDRLFALLPAQTVNDMVADPYWMTERPYHDLIRAGRTMLRDPADLADLFDALVRGVQKVCAATGRRCPDLPAAPGAGADLEVWDAAVARVMTALIDEDAMFRSDTLASRLKLSAHHLFSRSR